MSEIFKLAAGAFFGILVGLLVGWWKSHRDELRSLCDECCKTISEAGDVASKYWLSSSSEPENSNNEAKLVGYQVRLDGYRVLVRGFFEKKQRSKLDDAFVELYDSLTGSDFGSGSRTSNKEHAHLSQTSSSRAILAIRNGFYLTVSLKRIVVHPIRWLFNW